MAQQVMYPGINNSPQTVLSAGIAADDTTIPVAAVTAFPAGPNLATIGVEDDAEVVRYSSISGLSLINCERGFGGTTAKVWPQNELIYRGYTKYDHNTFKENIEDLNANKLDKTGDGKDVKVTATIAGSRGNLVTNDTLTTIIGKLMKWYSDFKALAWKATVGTADIDDNAITNAKQATMPATTFKGNANASAAAPIDLTPAQSRTLLNVADGADVTGTVLEGTGVASSIADGDKFIIVDVSESAGSRTRHFLWSSIKTALNAVFAPLTHASRHSSGGADEITPSSIGAYDKPLRFTDTNVPTGWSADSTYAGYGFRKTLALAGATAAMVPDVVFAPADAASGNFAPVAQSYAGGVYLYAKVAPAAAFTIPTITLWKAV